VGRATEGDARVAMPTVLVLPARRRSQDLFFIVHLCIFTAFSPRYFILADSSGGRGKIRTFEREKEKKHSQGIKQLTVKESKTKAEGGMLLHCCVELFSLIYFSARSCT
jgi:hypothetical protein